MHQYSRGGKLLVATLAAAANGFLSLCASKRSAHAFSSSRHPPTSPAARRTRCYSSGSMSSAETKQQHQPPPEHVVIAGAGVIGISTAYFLQKNFGDRIQSITLVDPTGTVAPAASGKAGGFLALDWNDYGPTQQLTRRSFALHQQVANDLGADAIDYRRLTCAAISVDPYNNKAVRRPQGQKLKGVEWAQPEESDAETVTSPVVGMRPLGTTETIAQVHPKKLCERMWQTVCDNVPNAKLVKGTVKGAVHSEEDGRLLGARLEDEGDRVVQGDALLFACGPWTADFVRGVKYHSVVLPTRRVLTQCVFFSGAGDPEVYVRPDQTAYCTGFPEPERVVTERPGHEAVQPDKVAAIVQSVRDASGGGSAPQSALLDFDNPVVEQACYLPTTTDGVPVMGALPNDVCGGPGCYIAGGHGCWGILLGPASGECMANLIMTGQSSTPHVALAPFAPARFRSFTLVP